MQSIKLFILHDRNISNIGNFMIARCFGHINKDLNLKEVERILNDIKTVNKEYKINKKGIELFSVKSVEKGRLKALIERDHLACLVKGIIKVNRNTQIINEEKNEIERKKEINEIQIILPFWIFKDGIVFSGAQAARDFLIPFLEDILNIKITIPYYDIGKIYTDLRDSPGRVFGFGFIERPNAINAGSIFGEMELDDPLVSELDDSNKSFVSINLKIKDSVIRITVYAVGSIVIMQKWLNMAETYSKLKIVKQELSKYETSVGS
ncbi:MAG: hypothetical protein ACP5U0_10355 [Caldisphaera sp.]